MSSPIPRFNPLPVDFVEKWHAQADIDDPPFKRPMLAQMAHQEARNRSAALSADIDVARLLLLVCLYRVAVFVALIVGLVAAIFAPILVVGVAAGVGSLAVVVLLFRAGSIARRRRSLAAQKLAADKEAEEHWNKFVKLTTEADSKIKVLEDAPVVSTTTPPSRLSEEN